MLNAEKTSQAVFVAHSLGGIARKADIYIEVPGPPTECLPGAAARGACVEGALQHSLLRPIPVCTSAMNATSGLYHLRVPCSGAVSNLTWQVICHWSDHEPAS